MNVDVIVPRVTATAGADRLICVGCANGIIQCASQAQFDRFIRFRAGDGDQER